jgi:NTE family protein
MSTKQQRRTDDARTALRSVPIFADIGDEQLDQLLGAVDRQHIPAKEWLFHLGDPSDAFYVIDSGRFVAVGPDGQVIGEMASGDSVGELGLIAGAARSAGVRALRDGVVWRIAAETFSAVLEKTPQLQSAMLRVMARMLGESRSANVARPRVIGILSTGDAVAAPIVDAIVTRLASHGQTAVVAPPIETTAAVAHHAELVETFCETLDRAERSNDWVLVVADRGSGDLWQRYVAAQSDRLVFLVGQRRPPKAVDRLVTQGPVHLITNTVEPDPSWWDLLQPLSHHPANDDGIAALARRIAGRSLGLVMAGGNAHGLAHFGVYEELTRAGVVIDRFGGTSSGAIAAAAFAMGMEAREATAAVRRFLTQTNPLSDYTIPVIALTRGGRIDHLLGEFFGSTLIEHLPRGFFSVSADMVTGDQIIHRRGLLSLAVRASVSVPGLMPPVQCGEQLLVDGGLLNNLPADVMCADRDGEVICVDINRKFVPSKGFGPLPAIIQPPGFVRRLLTGTDVALPPLHQTLIRTVDLAASVCGPSGNLRELPRIAAIIEPDISAIGPMDFKKIDAALDAGRIAARAALEAQPHLVR